MIKLMYAARAKAGLTRSQALEHLRSRHAPLVAASATLRQRMKTYIQNHALDVQGIPALTQDRDWIIESWRDPLVVLPEPPVAPDAVTVREDEARFPDRESLLTLQVEEFPVWQADPSAPFSTAPIKVFTYFKRPAGMTSEAFFDLWGEAAAALGRQPAFRAHALSYVRNRAVPGQGSPASPTASPSAAKVPPYDAVDIWRFADAASVLRLFEDTGFRIALAEFEKKVSAPGSLFRLVTEENRVFDDAKIDPSRRSS
jgi:hypothetical protein